MSKQIYHFIAAIGLIGWNLNETTKMRTEILQIQQGQVILFKKINRVQKVLKKKQIDD